MPPTGDPGQADRRRTAWRTRYALLGGVTAVVLIVWHFWDGRGDVLKADGGPVVTVMDFGQGFPLDPLPSGWKHRKFWTRTPMMMGFTVKDGVPSMRFETHDSGSIAVPPCRYRSRRLSDARVALVHRIADPLPARRAHAREPRSSDLLDEAMRVAATPVSAGSVAS